MLDNSLIENPFGGQVFYKEVCDSTMLEARSVPIGGSIYLTDHQTKPLARFPKRTWLSNKAENLTFTLVIKQQGLVGPVSLLAAVALEEFLRKNFNLKPQIKWPNDILVNNRKIAGILSQVYNDVILIGIGFNINQVNFGKLPATSLSYELKQLFQREKLLNGLLLALKHHFYTTGWLMILNDHLWKKDQHVSYQLGIDDEKQHIEGKLIEVSEDGALLIKVKGQGLCPIFAGETTLTPMKEKNYN